MRVSSCLAAVLLLTLSGCADVCRFKRYDYEKNEKARLELPRAKTSIDIDPDRLELKRQMKFPLLRP